jgi:CRP-like cAMP-binding protein
VRLEVRKLGRQHILVAEGEWCGTDAYLLSRPGAPGAATCARGTRLLWLDRQRFRERPLRSATVRSCLGPAWFPQTDLREAKLSTRWTRTLQRDLALAYEDERILVDEHITVNDQDAQQPSLPARKFREAQARIRVTLEAGELLSEGQSLWTAIRTQDGNTTPQPAPLPIP